MSSEEEHNKLTDEEKFKLIEFYKENRELWVTQEITRSQKALKKKGTSGGGNFQSISWKKLFMH